MSLLGTGGHAVEKFGGKDPKELGRSLGETPGRDTESALQSVSGHPRLMGWTWGLFRGNRILVRFSKGKS